MRKFLISLLAASMLVPAAASAQVQDRGGRDRSERSEKSDSGDRPQRADRQGRSEGGERPAPIERTERVDRTDRQPRVERRIERSEPAQSVERTRRIDRGNDDSLLGGLRATASRQQDGGALEGRRDRRSDRDGTTDWSRRTVQSGTGVDRDRDGRRDWRRDGDNDRNWHRDGDNDRRWSRDWRRDSRYNWYSYRSRYGSLFRLARYHDPYGYNYRRFSIGFNLWPSYYGSSFWLNDPWRYRLPPAYGPYRWVRYYGDALLVNTYTGQVVDVIHNVFW